MSTKVYLAARYCRRKELCGYRAVLEEQCGYTCTARWLDGSHRIDDNGLSEEAMEEERARFAEEDRDDLMRADLVISFTEPPRSPHSRGGRHVEFGMALAAKKVLIVIGHRENVFHCLDCVIFYPSWEAFLEAMV